MPRTDPRGGPATRARIARVASGMFAERGFDAVTVAEVARAAGVSAVTVFKHFPRKEDLYLDRADDAADLLRAAVSERAAGTGALDALEALALRLADEQHPLSGLDDRSRPFFATVAASPALVARARLLAADLEAVLAGALTADRAAADAEGGAVPSELLAALVVAGYATVLVATARRVVAGEPASAIADDHRRRAQQLFTVLRGGLGTT